MAAKLPVASAGMSDSASSSHDTASTTSHMPTTVRADAHSWRESTITTSVAACSMRTQRAATMASDAAVSSVCRHSATPPAAAQSYSSQPTRAAAKHMLTSRRWPPRAHMRGSVSTVTDRASMTAMPYTVGLGGTPAADAAYVARNSAMAPSPMLAPLYPYAEYDCDTNPSLQGVVGGGGWGQYC